MLVLKMQCVRLLGRITNISVLREKAVLHRTIFTMEGSGKGNIVPCSTARDMEQDTVMKLRDFNVVGTCEYTEHIWVQPNRGGPPAWVLGEVPTTPHSKTLRWSCHGSGG